MDRIWIVAAGALDRDAEQRRRLVSIAFCWASKYLSPHIWSVIVMSRCPHEAGRGQGSIWSDRDGQVLVIHHLVAR